jgi:L-seryl-tRNA(Ser) seleniumtransferase
MPRPSPNDLLRSIPSVDRLLDDSALLGLKATYSEELIKRGVRRGLDELREAIRQDKADESDCTTEAIVARITSILHKRVGRKLRPIINATGVIVHTNVGRSPLSQRVADRIVEAACSYSNLEYNLNEGRRGERNAHLRELIEELTGAEAALAVNNNAAAVLLALNSLALGKEVIVSRGELIEIGGSFRIPDVMARSGAILREVGTTNRTHPKDYLEAINEKTGLILKVHPSNYRVQGFTREVELDELALIGRSKGIPTMMDLGSGCLIDLSPYGLESETTVSEVVEMGIHIVTFSGDKLLGGPQAGLIVGRTELVEKMRTNPLARALRMDKLTLAGLEATLQEYARPAGPAEGVPTLDMIMKTPEQLTSTAESLRDSIRNTVGDRAEVDIIQGVGRVGGGALPMGDLPGPRVAVYPKDMSAGRLEQNLRLVDPPVIVLVKEDAVLIDPRTLLQDQAERLPKLIQQAFHSERDTNMSPH